MFPNIPPRNTGFGYDYGLGIDPLHIAYIRQSHLIQSRISPTPCYLLQKASGGVHVGYPASRLPLSNVFQDTNQFKGIIWNSGSNHPDLRTFSEEGQGNIGIFNQNTRMTRVVTPDDITNSNEFAVVKRKDLRPARVEIVFNPGFNPTILPNSVSYYFTTWASGSNDLTVKRGDTEAQSIYGWDQYINSYEDDFQRQNQILVRFPINVQDIKINEEGRVILENRNSWMIWEPYVNDFDMLILAPEDSPNGQEYRYEIVNSNDSVVQRQLTMQQFKLNLLEITDLRYTIPYTKSA